MPEILPMIQQVGNIIHRNIQDPLASIPGDLSLPFIGSTLAFSQDTSGMLYKNWKKIWRHI